MIPATGVLAPERTFVAVRAMAPVAGSPPKSGETMLATPWPINSTLGLCLSLLMRSETTADMSDSMAPSMATVKDDESGKAAGDAPEARSDRFDGNIQKRNGCGCTEGDKNRAGDFFRIFQAENHHGDGKDGYKRRRDRNGVPRLPERFHPVKKVTGDVIHFQTEEVADLRAGDEDGDTVGEANDDGARKIFHHGAHARHAQQDQQHTRHHRTSEKAVNAVLRDDACDNHDERACRSADLRFGAAQC